MKKASGKFEAERHKAAKKKRKRQKEPAASLQSHPKLSSVQSAVGGAHQESVSIATNEHERIDHQPSNNPRLRGMSHHHHIYLFTYYYF